MIKEKIKIGYLLYNERPNSGLMNTQVLGLLKELSKNNNLKITLIAIWQPWVYIKYTKEIEELKIDLKENNINLYSIPFALPSRHFFTNKLLLKINIIYIYIILKIFNLNKFDIIHCRGYFISYISALLKKDYKLIFDMRSLFPEENISSGNWTETDSIYTKWKIIEKFTIEKSDTSIGVSEPMVEILLKEYKVNKIKYIPIGYNSKNFIFNAKKRQEIRKKFNIENKIVIVYSGSLELGFWNDIRVYAKYFNYINEIMKNVHFLILTGSNASVIDKHLKDVNIHNYSILSVSSNKISEYLSASDVGIQVMDKMSDSETRFGVKTVEYLAMDLPIITNHNVGGIIKFIDINNLGVIINSKKDLNHLKIFLDNLNNYKDKPRIYANKKFNMKNISDECLKLYCELY